MNLDIEYLGNLSRIELTQEEKQRFSNELAKVLGHFEELKEVNTDKVIPMTGGTSMENIFRPDVLEENKESGKGANDFPDKKNGYLRVPKIF